jgi:heavy metal sensor kinase
MPLNIRWRLTLWNVLGLAVVLGAFAALAYGLLAHAHYERIDRGLQGEFRELEQDQLLTDEGRGRLRHWIAEAKEHENVFCVVYDAHGEVVERTAELAADSVPPAPQGASGGQQVHDATVPIVGRQRVLAGSLRWGNRPVTVVLMAPLEEVDRELALVRTALLLAVPITLAVAGAWGYLMARKALAPLEQLRRSTEEITASRLDRRLPVANTHDELGRLTQTVNAMIARLERSFAEIRRFTADASHELRTPLTVIRTEAEVALSKPLEPDDVRNLLGSILEECERLTRLTEQLLQLAREDAGVARVQPEVLDLTAVVRGVVEDLRPLAEARGLQFHAEVNGALPTRGDALRLWQVFLNVVDNAIKYTPAGGNIEVLAGLSGQECVVTVRDTGVGIAPEHVPRVFDRFYRADKGRSREQGGTGLGLSIAHSIVAAHGGRMDLASTPGKGTTCTVRLPAEPSP